MIFTHLGSLPGKPGSLLRLMRADRPIGTYLLLWPTLTALWLAAQSLPSWQNLIIFVVGTFLMRSAGCVINDFADRDLDGHVKRTAMRPLARGEVTEREALLLFAFLVLAAFGLVLLTNKQTVFLSFAALAVASLYPFMKRLTQLPQLVLGIAFSFGIPMAFSAEIDSLPGWLWWLFAANLCWTVAYDTLYAMVDRDDDLKIGIKSTAVLFGRHDIMLVGMFQGATLLMLFMLAKHAELQWPFYTAILLSLILFIHHLRLARHREREACFKAFLNNHWVGFSWLMGVVVNFSFY